MLHLMEAAAVVVAPGVGIGGGIPPAPDPVVLLWAVVAASADPSPPAAWVAGSPRWRIGARFRGDARVVEGKGGEGEGEVGTGGAASGGELGAGTVGLLWFAKGRGMPRLGREGDVEVEQEGEREEEVGAASAVGGGGVRENRVEDGRDVLT